MREAFYLASGFAFLAFLENPVSFRALKAESQCFRHARGNWKFPSSQTGQAFLSFIRPPAEIFFTLLLFVILEGMFEKIMPSPYPGEGMVPLLMLVSYAGARFFKKDNVFFLTLLAFGFFVSNTKTGAGFPEKTRCLAMMSLTFTAIRLVLEGLKFRLLFASPPKRLAGMPVLIFAFTVILMVFSAIKGIAE